MKCPRCGSEVPQGYAFCGRCGSSLFAANQQNYTQNFVNPQQQYNYQQYVQPKKQHSKGFYNLIGALIVLVLIGGFFGYVKIKTFIYDSKPSLLDYEVKTGEVLSGSGTNIGTYGYIDISKPRLERTSQEDYKKFCDFVSKQNYNYFAIKTGDRDTGICFPGCDPTQAVYGVLDDDCSEYAVDGYIVQDDYGNWIYSPK